MNYGNIPVSFYPANDAVKLDAIYKRLVESISQCNLENIEILPKRVVEVTNSEGSCFISAHGYRVKTILKHSFNPREEKFQGEMRFVLVDDNDLLGKTVCKLTFDAYGQVVKNNYFDFDVFESRKHESAGNILCGVLHAIHVNCCTLSSGTDPH